ncbi:hypothetical protein HDU97_006353 [Phlyctochytrium planicorne]|nr:hypothetical protein HDU97_006353 [Phlyctochytrium planicorne]
MARAFESLRMLDDAVSAVLSSALTRSSTVVGPGSLGGGNPPTNCLFQISSLSKAITCDVYMAVSYFQRGVCFFMKRMLREALADFTDALAFLRGNLLIDYTQLGLPFKLYACEVSFNRGLCFAALRQTDAALADFDDALRTRPLDGGDYKVIDEAIHYSDRSHEYCRPFEVPLKMLFRPPAGKVKNTEKINYLGKSKVVAAVDEGDNFAGFSGTKLKAETLSRTRTQGPLDGDNNFATPNTISRTAPTSSTLRRGLTNTPAPPPIGLDGTPVTYASLSRRAESATNARPPAINSTPIPMSSPSRSLPITPASPGSRMLDEIPRRKSSIKSMASLRDGMDMDEVRGLRTPASGREEGGFFEREMGGERLGRRNTAMSNSSSNMSSGDKLKIKCHFTDTRMLLVPVTITFDELYNRIVKKFNPPGNLRIKYKDQDNELVMITDQEDWEVALEMGGIEYGVVGGDKDRFELWCFAV